MIAAFKMLAHGNHVDFVTKIYTTNSSQENYPKKRFYLCFINNREKLDYKTKNVEIS